MLQFAICSPPSQSWLHFSVIQRFGSILRYLYSDTVCDSHLQPGVFEPVNLHYFHGAGDRSTWPESYKEFGVTTAEFAPTSGCDPAEQLMLMDFTLHGWPRPAWPCKPMLSDPMAKDKTLCPLKAFGGFCTWYFGGWCELLSYSAIPLGLGGWRQPCCFQRSTSVPHTIQLIQTEAKHEHQHGLIPSWIISFSVENQKMSKKWSFFCPTCGTCNFSGSFKDKMSTSIKHNWSPRKPFFPPQGRWFYFIICIYKYSWCSLKLEWLCWDAVSHLGDGGEQWLLPGAGDILRDECGWGAMERHNPEDFVSPLGEQCSCSMANRASVAVLGNMQQGKS